MFCLKCGAENKDGAKFCSACGASLTEVTWSVPEPVVDAAAPEPEPVPDTFVITATAGEGGSITPSGEVEVTVVDTDSANELELLSNGQIQAAALATNALFNTSIDRVVYNVYAYVDDAGNIQHDRFFGLIPAGGTCKAIFTFVWTKPDQANTSSIDWEMHIVGMDEQITSRIQEQVNSVSSLVEQPGLTQKEYDAQERERQMERLMHGSEIFNGGATEKTPEEIERLMQESYS